MSRRTERLAHVIQRKVSEVIQRDLQDPNIGFVTVTSVEVSPDLRNATLYVSVLGKEKDIASSLDHLRHALGYIRRRIAPNLDLRYAPTLSVVHDDSELRAEKIERLLGEIQDDEPKY